MARILRERKQAVTYTDDAIEAKNRGEAIEAKKQLDGVDPQTTELKGPLDKFAVKGLDNTKRLDDELSKRAKPGGCDKNAQRAKRTADRMQDSDSDVDDSLDDAKQDMQRSKRPHRAARNNKRSVQVLHDSEESESDGVVEGSDEDFATTTDRRSKQKEEDESENSREDIAEDGGSGSDYEDSGKKRGSAKRKRAQQVKQPERQQPKRGAAVQTAKVYEEVNDVDSIESGENSKADDNSDVEQKENSPVPKTKRAPAKKAPQAKGSTGKKVMQKGKQTNAAAGKGKKVAPKEPVKKEIWDENDVERILDARATDDGKQELYCKFKGMSYRKAVWVPFDFLMENRTQLLRNFLNKRAEGGDNDDPFGVKVNGVNPDWLTVQRIIGKRSVIRGGRHVTEYNVKWNQLPYSDVTWETDEELKDDKEHIQLFQKHNKAPPRKARQAAQLDVVPDFQNGRTLRDYQKVSLKWMISNWHNKVNCILGDEMGLGKTAQSISVLEFQRQMCGVPGPFLVVAPLTTLGHWQREIETWTGMYVVQYIGSAADREVIHKYEMKYSSDKPDAKRFKFQVMLTSYETVLKEKNVFTRIAWETVVIDEAHRMKSTTSATRKVVADMDIKWLLLLTGTPVQNNMRELYGIINLLDREKWGSEDDFLNTYGGREMPTLEQVQALQAELKPILLRRMKEDVEKLPEKEEIIVRVELTAEQRVYYKAIYSNQVGTLLAGNSNKNMPNLRNLAMELRKVCCHPYLCNGLADDVRDRYSKLGGCVSEREMLVKSSGKMVLLDKLLARLREQGKKVLIFSQFKIMLDVLEEYLQLANFPFERIDGGTKHMERQQAIDRFSKGEVDGFVFLLSTKAGGQGITLTAADTVVLYDSDWNPQNDLQAIARAHRIGQDKDVKIYRLVSNKTYEEELLKTSNRKQGLDAAILSGINSDSDPEEDSKRIAELLKNGANLLTMDEAGQATETDKFVSENIDEILSKRTSTRTLGGASKAGNMFSQVTFDANVSRTVGVNERDYWSAIMPEAVAQHDAQVEAAKMPEVLAPRQRRAVCYNEERMAAHDSSLDGEGNEDDVSEDDVEANERKRQRRAARDMEKEQGPKKWNKVEVKSLEDNLLLIGPARVQHLKEQAGLLHRPDEEVQLMLDIVTTLIHQLAPNSSNSLGTRVGSCDIGGLDRVHSAPMACNDTSLDDGGHMLDRSHSEMLPHVGPMCRDQASTAVVLPEGIAIPAHMLPALTNKDFQARLKRNAAKYAAALKDVASIAGLVAEAGTGVESDWSPPRVYCKGYQLPSWWDQAEHDRSILAGAYKHGYLPWFLKKQVETILSDSECGFPPITVQPDPSLEEDVPLLGIDFMEDGPPSVVRASGEASNHLPGARDSLDASAGEDVPPRQTSLNSTACGKAELKKHDSIGSEHAFDAAVNVPNGATPAAAASTDEATKSNGITMFEREWKSMISRICTHLKALVRAITHPEQPPAVKEQKPKPLKWRPKKMGIIGAELLMNPYKRKGGVPFGNTGRVGNGSHIVHEAGRQPSADEASPAVSNPSSGCLAYESPCVSLSPACAVIAVPEDSVRAAGDPKSSVKIDGSKRPHEPFSMPRPMAALKKSRLSKGSGHSESAGDASDMVAASLPAQGNGPSWRSPYTPAIPLTSKLPQKSGLERVDSSVPAGKPMAAQVDYPHSGTGFTPADNKITAMDAEDDDFQTACKPPMPREALVAATSTVRPAAAPADEFKPVLVPRQDVKERKSGGFARPDGDGQRKSVLAVRKDGNEDRSTSVLVERRSVPMAQQDVQEDASGGLGQRGGNGQLKSVPVQRKDGKEARVSGVVVDDKENVAVGGGDNGDKLPSKNSFVVKKARMKQSTLMSMFHGKYTTASSGSPSGEDKCTATVVDLTL